MVARAPEIVCGGNLVRVELDRVGEAPPPSPPADNGGNGGGNVPSSGEGGPPPDVDENAFAYVFTVGVKTKDDVCRSLSIHRIISSCEEINEPEEVVKSGTGWSTFVRSGQTIHVVGGVSYSEEPFWRVTFKEARKDGLEEVFVQRACGNAFCTSWQDHAAEEAVSAKGGGDTAGEDADSTASAAVGHEHTEGATYGNSGAADGDPEGYRNATPTGDSDGSTDADNLLYSGSGLH